MKVFKTAIITGSRSEYGILRSVIRGISLESNLEPKILVTAMHLEEEFGNTVNDIMSDGFEIAGSFPGCPRFDTPYSMTLSVAQSIRGCARVLREIKPDILVVLGDRPEALGSAVAATYLGIPIAHIHGGESTGNVDDLARNAITKLSHIHFAATKKSGERVLKMGERPDRVHVVGAPGLDEVVESEYLGTKELEDRYGFTSETGMALLVQHPVTSQHEESGRQIRQSLEALSEFDLRTVVIYPNSDAGGRRMIRVIRSFCDRDRNFTAYPSIPRRDYLGLLNSASVMVGNSSSGIIEAPSFHLPVVNIGIRQDGRERACNVIDVPHELGEIKKAIRRCLEDNEFLERVRKCENPWGDGKSGVTIAKVISGTLDSGVDLITEKLAVE